MENATKALLIAGSVLIAILLITMGIRIFSSTKGTVDSAQTVMDATSKSIVMNQFIPYISDNVSTEKVCEFLIKVAAYNATVSDNSKKIYINCWTGSNSYVNGVDETQMYNAISKIKENHPNVSWKIMNKTNHYNAAVHWVDYRGRILGLEITTK